MAVMTIDRITRSEIVASYEGMTITIEGEAFVRGYGSPDFVAESSSLQVEQGSVACDVDLALQGRVLDLLAKALAARSIVIEFHA